MKPSSCIILMAVIGFSSGLMASGNRHVIINTSSIEKIRELDSSQLSGNLKYLGTTRRWHLFGETMTSSEGGHPFDSSYAYKIARKRIEVQVSLTLNENAHDYEIHVPSCPTFTINKSKGTFLVLVTKQLESKCVLTLAKDESL